MELLESKNHAGAILYWSWKAELFMNDKAALGNAGQVFSCYSSEL